MKKTLHYYSKLDYTIRLKEEADHSYFAEIEELPGCFSSGETKEEAISMVEDAKQAWLETALEKRIPIPEPTSENFSGKLNLRLPKSLHRFLSYKAKSEGVSLNTLISTTLAKSL